MKGTRCSLGEFLLGCATIFLVLWFAWWSLESAGDRNARLLQQIHKDVQFGNK